MLDISSKTRCGLAKQYTVPYGYFGAMIHIEGNEVPPLGHSSWAGMKDGKSMCTAEEHEAITREVNASSWWPMFSRYLKDVSIFVF
jgi:hypothetical protein